LSRVALGAVSEQPPPLDEFGYRRRRRLFPTGLTSASRWFFRVGGAARTIAKAMWA